MFIMRILRSIFGYVTISVEGIFYERFLNLMTRRNIQFWNVKKSEKGIFMCVAKADFKRLREIAAISSCRVHIIKKKGTPFVIFTYRKRYGYFGGLVCFLLALWIMTSFIWSVELIGAKPWQSDEILATLDELGLRPGCKRSGVDTKKIKNEALLVHDDLAFVGISLKGTKAVVEVRPREKAPEIVPKDKPCDLVSVGNGQIFRMEVRDGRSLVTEGQAVVEGDMLVSGRIDTSNGTRLVHSMGDIYAETYYTREITVPYLQEVSAYTGRSKDKYSVQILNFKLNLYLSSSIPYAKYDKITTVKEPSVGGDFILPFSIKKDSYLEIENKTENISQERAEEIAAAACDEWLFSTHPSAVVVSRDITTSIGNDGLYFRVDYVCEENIAQQRELSSEIYGGQE